MLDQDTMDKEAVEDLFDISYEQLAYVNGAEPGTGLVRFGDKIVPFDNTMKKDSDLYRLFNMNSHEMVKKKCEADSERIRKIRTGELTKIVEL